MTFSRFMLYGFLQICSYMICALKVLIVVFNCCNSRSMSWVAQIPDVTIVEDRESICSLPYASITHPMQNWKVGNMLDTEEKNDPAPSSNMIQHEVFRARVLCDFVIWDNVLYTSFNQYLRG